MEPTTSLDQQYSRDQGGPQSEGAREAPTAGEYLDKALTLIGSTMRGAANVVKDHAPKGGVAKNAFESASRALDKTGQYIMGEHPSRDVAGVIKKYPLRSLAVCFLAGLLAGNVTRNAWRGVR